jgi:mannose-6-phosphate isomerase
MGAHPRAPSRVHSGGGESTLLELIAREPRALLGDRVLGRFGPRLPFLMKVLAAETPLSLQAHPNLAQARAGYAAEEAAGVDVDAAERNYRDPNHKPELICALEPFHALVGFRDVAVTLQLLGALDSPSLAPLLAELGKRPDASGLRRFFEAVMTATPDVAAALSREVLAACVAPPPGEFENEYGWARRLGELYAGDLGIVIALCLNLVTLAPGEALYLPAGNLHAYLLGTGVEIMASSDNVLRGGLTPKHVDVPELLNVLDFAATTPDVLRAAGTGAERVYRTPATEFRLSRIDLEHSYSPVRSDGPEILLATEGEVTLHAGQHRLTVPQGGSALIRACDPEYDLSGRARVFRATVSDDAQD